MTWEWEGDGADRRNYKEVQGSFWQHWIFSVLTAIISWVNIYIYIKPFQSYNLLCTVYFMSILPQGEKDKYSKSGFC